MFETVLSSQMDVTLAKINMDCPMLICVAPAMPSRVFATNALFPYVFEFALDFVFAEGSPPRYGWPNFPLANLSASLGHVCRGSFRLCYRSLFLSIDGSLLFLLKGFVFCFSLPFSFSLAFSLAFDAISNGA